MKPKKPTRILLHMLHVPNNIHRIPLAFEKVMEIMFISLIPEANEKFFISYT